jgi:hypothetical protein
MKWGEPSLHLEQLAGFHASPHGATWRQLAEQYRGAFAEALRGALVVLGREDERRAELYAWDPDRDRWLRLTNTGATVVAVLPGPAGSSLVAYVAYRELSGPGDPKAAVERPRVAVIDLAGGKVGREIAFDDVGELTLGWRAGKTAADEPTLVATTRGDDAATGWTLDWKRGQKKKAKKAAPGKDALVVARGQVRRLRLPVGKVTADWDDDGLASAIRLDTTRKNVEAPAGLLIDGHQLIWSPDRERLAMVAVPEGDCEAAATLLVVDAATGTVREIGKAAAPAPIRVDAAQLAYTDGDVVRIVDATTGEAAGQLASAGGVATAILDRSCRPPDEEVLFAPAPEEDVEAAAEEAPPAAPPVDAGAAPPPDAR